MATSFTHSLVAVAILTMAYCVVAMSAYGRADEMRAAVRIPAELLQWHSGFTVTSDSGVQPERKSTLGALDAEESRAFLVMHGAVGIRDVADDGFDRSVDFFDAPKGAPKSARIPAWTLDGSAQRGR